MLGRGCLAPGQSILLSTKRVKKFELDQKDTTFFLEYGIGGP
jgi:hypothetical protein